MTTEQKAREAAVAALGMAAILESEGDRKSAALFREIAVCSPTGLAALYDALKGIDEQD